jgi:hypothetical protein
MTQELIELKNEINKQLGDQETVKTLLATTFKGLEPTVLKRAIMEGMMRGFKFKDFLEKNIYAIPFSGGYSLVTSIDYARKIGMRSGVVGKSAPTYETDGRKIVSCSVTIKRKVGEHIGEYTATVYFDEYVSSRGIWKTKPRTMIAKVAEMHALRMACPEEMAQMYVEEEREAEIAPTVPIIDVSACRAKLEEAKSLEEVKTVWANIPVQAKQALEPLKNELKTKYENAKI